MRLRVRYFAGLREAVGCEDEPLELPAATTVAAARDALAQRHARLRPLLPACAAAVNRAYVPLETALAEGDELAFIPPLGGG